MHHRIMSVFGLAMLPLASLHAATCTVIPTDFVFGTYSVYEAAPLDGAAPFTVRCSSTTSAPEMVNYTISISGSKLSGSMMPRTMTGDGLPLQYNLYTDSGRTVIWGDGGADTERVPGSLSVPATGEVSRMETVFGRIPAEQPGLAPGEYLDMVVIGIDYQ